MFGQLEEMKGIGLQLRVLNLRGFSIAQLISKAQTFNTYCLVLVEECVRALDLAYPTLSCLLLSYFDWKLPNGIKNEELDMTESFGLAIGRKHDLCLIPITRRP